MAKETQVRMIAQAVIARVIAESLATHQPMDEALEAAYPFGARSGPAWRLWCEETHRALSLRSTAA